MTRVGHFDVHGLRMAVRGPWTELIERLELDFAWFAGCDRPNAAADFEIHVDATPRDVARYGDVLARSITPWSVAYGLPGGGTFTDHLGLASAELDATGRRLEIRGPDERLAHEAAYNGARAAIVRHLDRRDMMALHAVGLQGRAGAVVVLLPSGGGKSSLAVRALKLDGVQLLSDEMPILDRRLDVHPFPLRIGLTVGDPALVNRTGRTIEHLGWRPKVAVEPSDIADRIATGPVPLAHLVVATRTTAQASRLEPVDAGAVRGLLTRESIFRVATGQGAAWLATRRTVRSAIRAVPPVLRRAALSRAALKQAGTWRLVLGTDRDGNGRALAPLLTEDRDTRPAR